MDQTLGWPSASGSRAAGGDAGGSLRWLGDVAMWATELVAQGAWCRPAALGAHGGRSASRRPSPRALGPGAGGRESG